MKKVIIAMACAMALVLTVAGAQAATTYDLSYGDGYYVGSILTGEPSSPALELGYIQYLRILGIGDTATSGDQVYSRVASNLSLLPTVSGNFSYTSPTGANTWAVNVNDPVYLYGKYDGPNGGVLVWLVDAQYGDTISLPLKWGPEAKAYGISHLAVFLTAHPSPSPPPSSSSAAALSVWQA